MVILLFGADPVPAKAEKAHDSPAARVFDVGEMPEVSPETVTVVES